MRSDLPQLDYKSRVQQKLNQIMHYPLSIIVSPSGFGKEQFVRQFIESSPHLICHVKIDPTNHSFKSFIQHFLQSLAHIFPDTDWATIQKQLYPSLLFHEEVVTKWLYDLKMKFESYHQSIVIIIENYDDVEENSFIYRIIQQFMLMQPANTHILLTSRSLPTGEVFDLAQLHHRLLEINEQDLRMNTRDIEMMYLDEYKLQLNEREINDLYNLTLGWQMPLHAAYLYLSRGGSVGQIINDPISTLPSFYSFLENEILRALPSSILGFLYEISIFEELDIDLLNHLYLGHGSHYLNMIEKHRILLHSDVSTRKKIHPMIRHYLLSKIAPQLKRKLHLKASYYYTKRDDYISTISHFIAAEAWEELAYLISTKGAQMLYFGQMKPIFDALETLPNSFKKAFPRTLIVQGDYVRLHSDYNLAIELYQRAYKSCLEQNDYEGAFLAVEGEVRVYLDTVKPNKARALLRKTYYQPHISTEQKIRLMHLLAENFINSGKPKRAKKIIEVMQRLSDTSKVAHVEEVRLLLRTGQLLLANSILQRESIKPKEENPLIYGFRETSLVHSLVSTFIGDGIIAKKQAQQGILLGTKRKSPFIEATGWARMGHAMQIITPFNFELAEQCYQTSIQIFEEIGMEWGQAEPLMGLCLLHGKVGNYEVALRYGKLASRIATGVTDHWMNTIITICTGIATYMKENYAEALVYFKDAHQRAQKCGDTFLEAVSLLWLSYSHNRMESNYEMLTIFEQCLTLIETYGYDFLLLKNSFFGARDIQMNVPLLIEIKNANANHHNYAMKILKELGFSNVLFHPGYTLKIQTLGGFRVWLGDRELHEKDWQRVNAKRLFQYLITKRHQENPKEVIQAELWPDLDEDTLDRDFKVALNALTKALEPERKARSTSFYIVRNGTSYRLSPDSGYELDVEKFIQLFEDGLREKDEERARLLFESGIKLYKGDFLADNLYEDWAIEERERLQVLYLKGCERYAHILLKFEEYDHAIHICEKIIEKDPCWEEAYRILMIAYYLLKNRTMSLRWFEKCKQNLNEELGVEPMDTTLKLKEMIQNGAALSLDLVL